MMTSKLAEMQAKFHKKQIQEKEEKLIRLYESQQQKAFERVNRGSAGSNTSLGSTGGGKVRQMFDERRQKAGIDRSYPLEPLKTSKKSVQIPKVTKTDKTTKNSFSKTTTKIDYQLKNERNVDNRQFSRSVRTNHVVHESYSLNKTYDKTDGDLVQMVQNNLTIDLENEEMPQLEFMEDADISSPDEKTPKKLVHNRENNEQERNILGKTFRKESKPIVRRTVKSIGSPQTTSSPCVSPQSVKTSPKISPVKSVPNNMQTSSKTAAPKKTGPPSARAPSSAKPSAKQVAASPVTRDDLNECRYCSRRFAADRLEIHESICGKNAKKKRKVYDATKHRIQGTELEPYVKRTIGKGGKPSPAAPAKQLPKKDWRRTHEEFINSIRAAKMAQQHVAKGGRLADLPPPPPSSNPDYVQCPHCGRKFNEAAAERHIPKCATYVFNKPKPGAPPQKGRK